MTMPSWEERILRTMTPEYRLIVAMFGQALRDARHAPYRLPPIQFPSQNWQARENAQFADARAWFLTQREEVVWWLDLLDLPEGVWARLLRAAGLQEDQPPP